MFELMHNGKALTKEELEKVQDMVIDMMNRKIKLQQAETLISERLNSTKNK